MKRGLPWTSKEKLGIIKGYGVRLDYSQLERGLHAFILVTVIYRLPDGTRLTQEDVAKKIRQAGAEEAHIVTGTTDILIGIRVKAVQELNAFVIDKLRKIDGVDKTQTMIVSNSF